MKKLLLLCFLPAVLVWAQETPRPACNALHQGKFWPEAANTDPAAARRAAQCGQLEMCTLQVWRYKWKALTVHVARSANSEPSTDRKCTQPLASPPEAPGSSTNSGGF